MASPVHVEPELFWISPTPHIPNSKLPILVYRNALSDTSPENILRTIEPNDWLKGGQWKTYKTVHFHTTVHECYAIIRGRSVYQLGKSLVDDGADSEGHENGMQLSVEKGDVFVFPAGVSHGVLESEGDYEIIGLYPRDSSGNESTFDMNFGLQPVEETEELKAKCEALPIPVLDPLYGSEGPLPRLWKQALDEVSKAE